ncbi:MAG: endonuclease Q family protein [Candidatus Aenigmarchaeota archaeon]|nr:endonuclease Q family protein [Candidatus Aenigmarchaeota archaeon]
MQTADFHIHSKYSRATSGNMVLPDIAKNAKIKGIDIVGTGDFTHPIWLGELKQKLKEENGIYSYDDVNFVLSTEISLIYKQGGKCRRIHHLILAPNFSAVDQINEFLDKKGRRDYDGRPIFGFTSIEMVDVLMGISKDIEIIPAHAWTPWYGIFGSMSGFDSLEECFGEKTKYIHSIETGMSSDPAMNWRISALDSITLTSNSDAHSPYPWRLGREANVFDFKEINYENIINSIRTRKDFAYTIEVDPNYGKYHYDGHRLCNFSCSPKEAKKLKDICPKCGKPLVTGVLNRVEQLADREEGFVPKDAVPFKSLLPLSEVVAASVGQDVFTKKVWEVHNRLMDRFGNEFNVLLNVEKKELEKTIDEKLADLIIKNREGRLTVIPGYDGVYGVIKQEEKGLNKFLK